MNAILLIDPLLLLPYFQNALLSKNRQCVPVIHPREHPMTHLNALILLLTFLPQPP